MSVSSVLPSPAPTHKALRASRLMRLGIALLGGHIQHWLPAAVSLFARRAHQCCGHSPAPATLDQCVAPAMSAPLSLYTSTNAHLTYGPDLLRILRSCATWQRTAAGVPNALPLQAAQHDVLVNNYHGAAAPRLLQLSDLQTHRAFVGIDLLLRLSAFARMLLRGLNDAPRRPSQQCCSSVPYQVFRNHRSSAGIDKIVDTLDAFVPLKVRDTKACKVDHVL